MSKSRKDTTGELTFGSLDLQGQGRSGRWKGEGEARSRKEEESKRTQLAWGPREARVASGDGLHGGQTGGKNREKKAPR